MKQRFFCWSNSAFTFIFYLDPHSESGSTDPTRSNITERIHNPILPRFEPAEWFLHGIKPTYYDICVIRTKLKKTINIPACDVETLSMVYGLCWEPTMTQCSLAMNLLTGNSKDPSPPLPWWDKVESTDYYMKIEC